MISEHDVLAHPKFPGVVADCASPRMRLSARLPADEQTAAAQDEAFAPTDIGVQSVPIDPGK